MMKKYLGILLCIIITGSAGAYTNVEIDAESKKLERSATDAVFVSSRLDLVNRENCVSRKIVIVSPE